MSNRTFSPVEINHLSKYGFSDIDLSSVGEKPVEYVTGHAEFMGLDFHVTQDTLIPRIESEKIVEIVLGFIENHQITHPFIADIGTGSGCLGLSVAVSLLKKQHPYSIFLSDFSQKALKVSRENAANLLSSPANLFFEQSDLLTNYPHVKFDIVIANLPYIPSARILSLDSSVKDFEPTLALDGGTTGTEKINQLLDQVPKFLKEDFLIVLEIDSSHSLTDFHFPVEFHASIEKDLFDQNRFLVIGRKS